MRIMLFGVGAIAALILFVVAIGYSLPVNHRGTGEATLKASPESVFALITNVAAFPSWRSGVKSAEAIASPDGKRRFRETSSDGTIPFLIEAIEPNKRLVTRIDDPKLPFGGSWTYEIIPAADGRTTLRITEDGEVYNPVFRFVSRFIMGHDATIKTYLADASRKLGP